MEQSRAKKFTTSRYTARWSMLGLNGDQGVHGVNGVAQNSILYVGAVQPSCFLQFCTGRCECIDERGPTKG